MQLFGSKKNGKHSGSNIPEERYEEPVPEFREASADDLSFYSEPEPSAPQDELPPAFSTGEAKEPEQSDKVREIVEGKKKSKKKKAWKVILIVLLVLVLLAAATYVVIEYFMDPPEVDPTGPTTSDEPDIPHIDNRRDGVYTFLVAGVDQISSNTDTIMVGSFDVVNHKLNVVSIPRDTLINIQHEVKKANAAYHFAHYYTNVEGSSYYGVDPIASMRQELVRNMLGFDVDSYVLVNLDACEQVVDCIGGVKFDLPINMNYDSNHQDLHIHLDKGPQTLSGEDFVHVMRFRSAYSGGDLDRIEMQHKLLSALADQMLTLKNIPNVTDVIKIVSDNMQTNMSTENMLYFAKEFLKLEKSDIQFLTMPKLATGSIYGQSYVFADIDAWLMMVNQYLNPWKEDIKPNNINMVTFKDGNFYSTTSELSGGTESFTRYSGDSVMDAAEVLPFESANSQNKDVG